MDFKIRYSSFFKFKLANAIIWLGLAILDFVSPMNISELWHYKYLVEALTAFLWLLQIYRPLYSGLFNKPILTANEEYIYDFANDIIYYWKDISDVYEEKSSLFINLYPPNDYLNRIGNPVRRFITRLRFKPNRKRSLFFIDIDLVDVDRNDLLEILDNYSIKAMAIDNALNSNNS
jgi:hypothetical protein